MSVTPELHYGDVREDKYVLKRYDTYIQFMREFVKDKNEVSVLDVGGYFTFLLHLKDTFEDFDKIAHYEILDFDTSSIDIVKQAGAITTVVNFDLENLEDVSRLDGYDIVICTEVLEHLVNPPKHIASLNELVKSDGICIISLPNENSIFHRLMSVIGAGVDQCAFELYKHLHLPTINQSKKFVGTHLDVQKITYYINPSLTNSRMAFLGKIITLLPDGFWWLLTRMMPALFARGIVFECRKVAK